MANLDEEKALPPNDLLPGGLAPIEINAIKREHRAVNIKRQKTVICLTSVLVLLLLFVVCILLALYLHGDSDAANEDCYPFGAESVLGPPTRPHLPRFGGGGGFFAHKTKTKRNTASQRIQGTQLEIGPWYNSPVLGFVTCKWGSGLNRRIRRAGSEGADIPLPDQHKSAYQSTTTFPHAFTYLATKGGEPTCSVEHDAILLRVSASLRVSLCGRLTADNGSFSSQNYPNNYPNDHDCRYEISVSSPKVIKLTFTDFQVEEDYDYVYVYDGNTTDSTYRIAVLTGTRIPGPVTSSGSFMTVRLVTDETITRKGFQVNYTAEDKVFANCEVGEYRCADGVTCIDAWKRCDGNNDCRDGSDEDAANCAGYRHLRCQEVKVDPFFAARLLTSCNDIISLLLRSDAFPTSQFWRRYCQLVRRP
ncbi:hypothetical protein Bbelb_100620 [Branchiostoma belcheri]|nr:hypothetical protein Bbelb_100620 [Branchiostoma belcheri]